MKTALGWLALTTAIALVPLTSGCEVSDCDEETGAEQNNDGACVQAESLTRYVGDPIVKSSSYTAGASLSVEGHFGEVKVIGGAASDEVKVTFELFSYRGHTKEVEAREDIANHLKTDVTTDAAGAVLVKTWKEGESGSSLGANMVIELPTNFSGLLKVINYGNGNVATHREFDIDLDTVGGATSLDVHADSDLSDCFIDAAPSVTDSKVNCGGFVRLLNVSDNVFITTRSGTVIDDAVQLKLASVADGSSGEINTVDGTVAATFPLGGSYSIQAFSPEEGTVSVDPATGCETQEAAPGSKTVTCGSGGPLYKITAGTDSLGESNINLKFE